MNSRQPEQHDYRPKCWFSIRPTRLTSSDDDCITSSGYLECPNPVPLIAGFNILTRTVTFVDPSMIHRYNRWQFRILGDIIIQERDLQRRPPSDPEDLLSKVKECRLLARRIKDITINLPSRFVLEDVAPSSMYVYISTHTFPCKKLMSRLFTGWKGEMQHQVDLFSRESGDHELKDNDYLILKSNIHVTLAMTRLRLMWGILILLSPRWDKGISWYFSLYRESLLNLCGYEGSPERLGTSHSTCDVDWYQLPSC
jgi:hypothetical protein